MQMQKKTLQIAICSLVEHLVPDNFLAEATEFW